MAGIPPLPATTPKPDRYGSGFDAWYDPDSNWSSGVPSDNGYAPDGSREGNIDGDVSGSDSSVETLKPHIELELGDKGNGETDEDMGRIGFLGPTRTAPEGRKTTETDVGTTTEVTPTASPTETGTSIQLSTDPVNSKSSATVSTLPTPSTPSSAATVAESEMTSGLLPAWAIVLIAIGAVMFLIFAVSLVVFCMKGEFCFRTCKHILPYFLLPPMRLLSQSPSSQNTNATQKLTQHLYSHPDRAPEEAPERRGRGLRPCSPEGARGGDRSGLPVVDREARA